MELKTEIKPKDKCGKLPADESTLGFGVIFTDHMFSMSYSESKAKERDKGWHDAKIGPYGPISLDPAAIVFHYGQEVFEGMKAYRWKNDDIYLFRPMKNLERMLASAERMVMQPFAAPFVLEAIKELVKIEKDWVPKSPMTSLYIRPTYIGTKAILGVQPSSEYLFYVILSPVGAYYATGFNPVKILVEEKFVRASPGGVGFTKAGGNYAASLLAAKKAKERGYTQVLWLDAAEHKYVEEVGTMNQFFVIGDTILTAPLTGSILPGVTRDSIIHMAKDYGYKVEERLVSIDEVITASENGTLTEAFGTGTAAVVTPVGELCYKDKCMVINDGKVGKITQRLYDDLVAIQYGEKKDPYDWLVKVC
ncbi:MAG: branched-chain amino acid aminotransferase [Candidatus Lokiarchaeota archaeon]|nr:branched-chain amino acid aminotransferase [Candidatus Lokiarchaeota archaeon]